MKKSIISITIVLIGIIGVMLGRWFFFDGGGSYSPPAGGEFRYEYAAVPPLPVAGFSDTYEKGEGVILIDLAHDNAFEKGELNVLLLRLVSRGLTIRFLSEEDDLKKMLLVEDEEEEGALAKEPSGEAEEEPPPNAFIIVAPQTEFSKEERETVEEFVNNGGKLLLIADPTRHSEINSLSLQFGLIFEADFLYNMKENEINYRNIFVTEFSANDITRELKQIALYTAGSVSSDNASIAFVDENTFSSVIETREKLAPIALAQESRVLAIYDLTFMVEPHNGALDNNRLISNIADWLMSPAEGDESK